jgi:hypothetical protein
LRGFREEFSGLKTVWRWTQSVANLSANKIPVNREIYREFWLLRGFDRAHLRINAGVSSFQPEIVTGNEQGNNKRENRENMSQNMFIGLPDARGAGLLRPTS